MASVISSSPRGDGLDGGDGLVDARVEQVDAHQREVRRRVIGLLDQSHDTAVGADLGDAEALRIGHLGQQDLGRGAAVGARPAAVRLEAVDELGDALAEQVVAEVHHEVVVAEERLER